MALKNTHPYTLKQARWIRQHLIMEKDKDKRKDFLKQLESLFKHKYAEILNYISNDYRVMLRDDQLWDEFDSPHWNGKVWSCGRAYGKALRNDQLIRTPEGFTPIGELRVGDEVVDRNLNTQKVTATYPQGVVDLHILYFSNGGSSVACKDHLWKVSIDNGETFLTIKTRQVIEAFHEGCKVVFPTTYGNEHLTHCTTTDRDYATCISVSGEDRLYVLDNDILTHNTYCGAPATIEFAMTHPDCRIGLIAPTFGMGRTNMIEGSSGILKLSPRGFKPKYNKSDGTLEWPNGATAKLFSAENGDRLRGENFHFIWTDEFCFCKFTNRDDDFWKMAKMALRAGRFPKYIITTSPRPIKALKELYEQSQKEGSKILFTTGTTFDNYTLPESFLDEIRQNEGTSLYNQEVLGIILDENPSAIFSYEDFQRLDLDGLNTDPDKSHERWQEFVNSMDKIVVAVDPNVVEDEKSDETGIVVAGRKNDKGYILEDASRRGKIKEIYRDIVNLYHKYRANCVVVETNNGGDFIPNAIYNIDDMVVVEKVFASRGKRSRAEPISLLYENKRIWHLKVFQELENQMTEYNPQIDKKSPDRMDAVVWALSCLFPRSQNGLFDVDKDSDDLFKKPKKGELEDLHAELYKKRETQNSPFSLGSGDDFYEDEMFSLH